MIGVGPGTVAERAEAFLSWREAGQLPGALMHDIAHGFPARLRSQGRTRGNFAALPYGAYLNAAAIREVTRGEATEPSAGPSAGHLCAGCTCTCDGEPGCSCTPDCECQGGES